MSAVDGTAAVLRAVTAARENRLAWSV